MSFIWKTKDCFDCPLKRGDVCYWGIEAKTLQTDYNDGTIHKRARCQRRWKPQPENHVELPEKGRT